MKFFELGQKRKVQKPKTDVSDSEFYSLHRLPHTKAKKVFEVAEVQRYSAHILQDSLFVSNLHVLNVPTKPHKLQSSQQIIFLVVVFCLFVFICYVCFFSFFLFNSRIICNRLFDYYVSM